MSRIRRVTRRRRFSWNVCRTLFFVFVLMSSPDNNLNVHVEEFIWLFWGIEESRNEDPHQIEPPISSEIICRYNSVANDSPFCIGYVVNYEVSNLLKRPVNIV